MIGFGEIIVLLLSLGGFGLTPNPTPATPDQSLAYAVADADLIVTFDVTTVVPGNYKALLKLSEDPTIKAIPELREELRRMVGQVEGGRGMASGLLGIDVTTDIQSATAFLQIVPQREPNYLVAVRGKFPADLVSKAAKLAGGAATAVGTGSYAELQGTSMGLTKDGVLLLGSAPWIKARLDGNWRAPARPAGGTLAKMAEVLAAKPFLAIGGTLSPTTRKQALESMKSPNFLADLVKRHKFFALAMYIDGIGWRWDDSSKAGVDSMKLFSEGMIELMRAAQVAPRGVAKMAAAAMESYRGMNKQLDDVIRRKDDLLKLVDSFSGDGKFAATINADPRTFRLDVRATGAHFSEVVPFGLIAPFAGGSFLWLRASSAPGPGPVMVEPPSKTQPANRPQPTPLKPGAPKKPKTMEKTTH
jgi:hypothetical protein